MTNHKYRFDKEAHVHYLDDKPLMGTSTICKIIAKPLTWWASGKALEELGWVNSKLRINGKYQTTKESERIKIARKALKQIKTMSAKNYLVLLDRCYRTHDTFKLEKAVIGTDRHAVLEQYVKYCIQNNQGKPDVENAIVMWPEIVSFIEFSIKNIKKFLWSEVHGYSEKLWTGGIADVGWLDLEDRIVGADFKSSKDAYFDQFIQCAGYDIMLSENGGFTDQGKKIFELPGKIVRYCIVPFGQAELRPVFSDELTDSDGNLLNISVDDFKDGFRFATSLYKLSKLFNQD